MRYYQHVTAGDLDCSFRQKLKLQTTSRFLCKQTLANACYISGGKFHFINIIMCHIYSSTSTKVLISQGLVVWTV